MKKIIGLFAALFALVGFTSCSDSKVDLDAKEEGTMTHAEYTAAELDSEVVIEAFIQGKQSWWSKDGNGRGTFYLQDGTGGYFAYELGCTEEQYNNELVIGAKVKITGNKAEWAGEVEVVDATWEVLSGNYIATAKDVTSVYNDEEELVKYQNMLVAIKGLTVKAKSADAVIFYQWNGAGSQGDDIYFDLTDGTNVYTVCIESYLCNKDSDVYKAAEALKDGDKIDVEGFLYWYEGAQPHITKIIKK